MKLVVSGVVAFALACGAFAVAQDDRQQDGQPVSVLRLSEPVSNDVTLQEPAAPQPTIVQPVPSDVVMAGPVADACCNPCCPPPCVPTTLCLVDPCGCEHEACVEIPACCVGQQPTVNWRNGVFGRQVAMLCWECCDFEAKVIVTRNGNVRVRS